MFVSLSFSIPLIDKLFSLKQQGVFCLFPFLLKIWYHGMTCIIDFVNYKKSIAVSVQSDLYCFLKLHGYFLIDKLFGLKQQVIFCLFPFAGNMIPLNDMFHRFWKKKIYCSKRCKWLVLFSLTKQKSYLNWPFQQTLSAFPCNLRARSLC